MLSLAAVGVALAGVGLGALLSGQPPGRAWPRGESYDGLVLPAAHPLQANQVRLLASSEAGAPLAAGRTPALSLKYGCLWGKPGRSPYQGTVEQALETAALPAEVVAEVSRLVQAGTPVERLEIGTSEIRASASGRVFDPTNVAMTYGRTLCLGTRVNFEAGHTEPASLYEAADRQGRTYAVMVPDVCGNVSVIATDTRDSHLLALASDGRTATQTVPEPGTLACVLGALGLLGLHAGWRRRRR